MSSKLIKIILIVAVIVYIVSPVDLVPGPVDDLILALLTLAARKHLSITEE